MAVHPEGNAYLSPADKSANPGKSEPGPARSLGLCIPMYRDISYETWDFVDQLRSMKPPAGWNPINVFPAKSHPVFVTREAIVEQVLSTEKAQDIRHDILLWVDADCGLKDAAHAWALVERLQAAPATVGMLGVPCRMRGFQENEANVSHFPDRCRYELGPDQHLPSHEYLASEGCPFVVADAVGFGVIAMRMEIFHRLPKPWFVTRWAETTDDLPATQRLVGEDIGFCRRVRKELRLQTVVDYGITAWHLVETKAVLPAQTLFRFNPDASWK